MSQGKSRRSQAAEQEVPVKYGDIFNVSGELADKPVRPEDASMMQTAESTIFGKTKKGGPASSMQSAADHNERAGLVGHYDVTDIAGVQGVSVTETDVPGGRIITEAVGGQVVGQHVEPTLVAPTVVGAVQQGSITIGEALEATAQTASDKPVDQSDAAAIQAAEVRATGSNVIIPGGLAASAQSAAAHNESVYRYEDKIKLGAVLTGATRKLAADKAATRQDAEGVVSAELRNNPNVATHPGGVAASVAAAARLNENVR
ncbi:hypothetical protein Dsin_029619 [Dipteronia sinensis]|uniref:SMP domain-containing protein n=1 Tax=Dipteronia sinensis TaxID=43782 RepID=A0AAE0DVC2_9ROSI|nr:hypothetical protein Dsin_029619 [Dipteronia sinensis]